MAGKPSAAGAVSTSTKVFYSKGRERLNPNTNPLEQARLRLSTWEVLYLLIATAISYGLFAADITAGNNYRASGDNWWMYNTFAAAFVPGLWHCLAQHYSYYQLPTDLNKFRQMTVGEKPPLLEKRDPTFAGWVGLYVINILQLRMLYEAYLSFRWGFVTGGYRDTRVIQVVFQAVPQLCIQSWILFRQWNEEVEFTDWSPTFVSMGFAITCVTIMPNESPCFQDNDRLVRMNVEEDSSSDEESESDSGSDSSSI